MNAVGSGRPAYREVADHIRAAIEVGTYKRGQQMPKEEVLAGQLGVDRSTVNRAYRLLVSEGLAYAQRGRGTFLNKLPPITWTPQESFDEAIRTLGYTPRWEVQVKQVPPPAKIAEVLDVSVALCRSWRMWADDVPVQISTSYIPEDIATGIRLEDSGPPGDIDGILGGLADLGHPQVTQRICVRPPRPAEASFLQMTEDQRVYEITHTGRTAERAIVVRCVVMPTHQWVIECKYPVEALRH